MLGLIKHKSMVLRTMTTTKYILKRNLNVYSFVEFLYSLFLGGRIYIYRYKIWRAWHQIYVKLAKKSLEHSIWKWIFRIDWLQISRSFRPQAWVTMIIVIMMPPLLKTLHFSEVFSLLQWEFGVIITVSILGKVTIIIGITDMAKKTLRVSGQL